MVDTLKLPFLVTAAGAMAALTQGSPAEIAQSVGLLLDTRPGERRSVPDYGLPDPVFSGVDVDELAAVIEEWEPRADPADIDLATAPSPGPPRRLTYDEFDDQLGPTYADSASSYPTYRAAAAAATVATVDSAGPDEQRAAVRLVDPVAATDLTADEEVD